MSEKARRKRAVLSCIPCYSKKQKVRKASHAPTPKLTPKPSASVTDNILATIAHEDVVPNYVPMYRNLNHGFLELQTVLRTNQIHIAITRCNLTILPRVWQNDVQAHPGKRWRVGKRDPKAETTKPCQHWSTFTGTLKKVNPIHGPSYAK